MTLTPPLADTLHRAADAVRRSVRTVRTSPDPVLAAPPVHHDHATLRPRGREGALQQSIAALQGAAWIVSFVESVFLEIRGHSPEETE
jgi:hypothetical protein